MTKNTTPYESIEQITFVNEFRRRFEGVLIHSTPNSGKRHKSVAKKMKDEGQVPGIPDLTVPAWRLYIEMKRQKGGSLSEEQKEIIAYLELHGYTVIIGYGWQDAMQKALEYGKDKGYI